MCSASVDKTGQVLRIKFAGDVGEAGARACASEIERLLTGMQPGFTLLTDLSDVDRMDLACEPVIGQLMESLSQHGIRRVLRVVPDPRKDIGFGIISLFHYGQGVRMITCKTLAEAEEHLR